MKRYAALFLSILLLISLPACGGSAKAPSGGETSASVSEVSGSKESGNSLPDEPVQDTQASDPAFYDELIERFFALVSQPYGDSSDLPGEIGVLEAARDMGDNALNAIGYVIEDLSGDGVPELAVGSLAEYGGQINALYTLVEGEPQLVLEGWYRSSWFYEGDGRFYYSGSDSASVSLKGSFVLTRDGTALECEYFYFTSPDEESNRLRIYYNKTGSTEIADSQEVDMPLEDFSAIEAAKVNLPLTSFSDYAVKKGDALPAEEAVCVWWGEPYLSELKDYEEFVADNGEYAAEVLFTATHPVTKFELYSLTVREVYDDKTVSYAAEPLYSLERLTPERPLVVRMTFPGDLPAYGVSYLDERGVIHRFTVEISGEDGSLLLKKTDEAG